MAPGRTKQQEKLPDGCAKWSATDFEMHREIILVKLTKGVAIPEGELSPNISDGERKLFRSLARKEGTTPQLQEWSLGPGKEHVSLAVHLTSLILFTHTTGMRALRVAQEALRSLRC